MGAGLYGGFGKTRGGRAAYRIHKGRQDKHIVGTNNYKQQIAGGKHPSILTEDAQTLLKDTSGKVYSSRQNKVGVDYGRTIGKYYNEETNQYYDTSRATIHYDSHGNAHIVPARPTYLR